MAGLFLVAALAPWPTGSSAGAAAGCPAPLPDAAYATRCTGGTVVLAENGAHKTYRDCPRGARPTRVMAPKLKALVEKLRCALGDRVVITSGFRSHRHNLYSWAYVQARMPGANPVSRNSRHGVGKAVDFYVRGFAYGDLKSLETKLHQWAGRLPRPLRGSSEAVWTHVYRKGEGRDPDNLHPYPYLHLQLRD